jgi:hypothetical protein
LTVGDTGLSSSTNLKTYHSTLGDSQGKRQSILIGLAKVCAALAPNMQFYFYRIDKKVMGTKWSRALALLLCKEERGLLEGLVPEVLEERLWYSVT